MANSESYDVWKISSYDVLRILFAKKGEDPPEISLCHCLIYVLCKVKLETVFTQKNDIFFMKLILKRDLQLL